ncbi:MAG: SPOR domain-containing protein [Longimicrobiales bacterium]
MRFILLVTFAIVVGPAQAQQRVLDRTDSLLMAGQYAQARATLADWQRAHPPGVAVEPAERSRALYLMARLTTAADDAQDLYLSLVLSYPTAREAPDALLRLGQHFVNSGDPARAQGYLERLVNDYPAASNRMQGYLWLARAQSAAGSSSAACASAGAALKAGATNEELTLLLQEEEKTACANAQREPPPAMRAPLPAPNVESPPVRRTTTAPARTQPARSQPRTQPTRTPSARTPSTRTPPRASATSSARYALQTGAFREIRSANATAAELERKGFDARVVYTAGSSLARVRVGKFRTSAAASEEARKLRTAGVRAIVVDDVARERAQR